MDTDGLNKLVEDKVQECIRGNNADLLRSIEGMVAKISAPSVTHVVTAVETPTFKRRSNEEQYKQNAKILDKLTVVADNLTSGNIPDAKEAFLEAKDLVRKRQKLIQLADTSELGWRTVAEYEMNPIASDSDDEKRMYRAESRASRKAKADRGRRRGRTGPYRRRASYTASQAPAAPGAMQQGAQGQRQRSGMCFICDKPGHWKRECPQSSYANNKISIMSFPANVETLSMNCMNATPANTGFLLIRKKGGFT